MKIISWIKSIRWMDFLRRIGYLNVTKEEVNTYYERCRRR
jgi:hypothetical protein